MTAAEGRHNDLLSQKALAKMPNTADENLTYCSETMWEIHQKKKKNTPAFPKPDFKFTVYFPR